MPKKIELEPVSLGLTKPQLRKLHKGQCCQLKPDQMRGGSITLMLSRGKVRKIRTAHKKSKGLRLKMTPDEIEQSGEGFKEIMKNVGEKIKKGIKKAGPYIRKGLTEAVKVGLPALAVAVGQPELALPAKVLADTVAKKAVDKLGDVAGFGMKRKRLKDDYSNFQASDHPAMSPHLPLPDFSKPNPHLMSGSGLIAKTGSQLTVSMGGRIHPAMKPALPAPDFSRSMLGNVGGSFLPAGY